MSPLHSVAPNAPSWVAHKFGGSSVADPERIRHLAALIKARPSERQAIVVSAMKGTTDALIVLGTNAAAGARGWRDDLAQIAARHREAADALLGSTDGAAHRAIAGHIEALGTVLESVALLGSMPAEIADFVAGMGEVLSATLIHAFFNCEGLDCEMIDAREVLVVRQQEAGAVVVWPHSRRLLAELRAHRPAARYLITGYVARDAQGRATTLGRNGSDYSGAIFGALFGASSIEIWTDVDGVLSADPRLVPDAEWVPELSYGEACELAYFGARVIHPRTMQPAIEHGIPIRIRNSFRPEHPGTLIGASAAKTPPVKGVTAIRALALINVEGTGLVGVPGTAERLFEALYRVGVSVVMISQASSEHSICVVVAASDAVRAVEELELVFEREIGRRQIHQVLAEPGVGVLAIVGDGMAGTPGVAARLFDALARAQINVRAIAQGSSERNISVAIADADVERALRAVHSGFYLSAQTLSIGVIGPGGVGAALLDQLARAAPRLKAQANLDLRVRAIADSKRVLNAPRRIELADWREQLQAAPAAGLDAFTEHVAAAHLPHQVIIDCSASSAVADRYADWLAAGIHVITPNKQAGSGPMTRYAAIRAASAASGARFRVEATVGAGLPVISTLRDLLDSGDAVIALDGIFSGTLAYLFNRFDGSAAFSALVTEARAKGYTEPDPRDDLSGADVARKLTILAREMGLTLELEDVNVESLVPEALRALPVPEFMAALPILDAAMGERLAQAQARGRVLRYVARLDASGAADVGLTEVSAEHAFAHIRLTDNVVQFTTERYRDNPLVVQGPGAGPEVTAAGVFADLLRIAAGLGARL